jgi:hypothetical protein
MNLIQNLSSSSNDFLSPSSSESPPLTQTTTTNSASSMMASAFASVSEMANKANNMFIPNESAAENSAPEFVINFDLKKKLKILP